MLAISTGKLPFMRKIGDHIITGMKSFYKSNNCYMSLQLVGNKAKERISKRVFQENKARQIFRKTNISYPLIRARTCAYQGLRKVRFSENLAYFVFLKTRFEVHPFGLLPTNNWKNLKLSPLHSSQISWRNTSLLHFGILWGAQLWNLPPKCIWTTLVADEF